MAAGAHVSGRVGGQIVRYATVIVWLLCCFAPARAQQLPEIAPIADAPADTAWDTVTAPAKKVAAPSAKVDPAKATPTKAAAAKAAPTSKTGGVVTKTMAGTTIVLPALTTTPEGAGGGEAAPVIKKGHKGDPVVVQTELPPVAGDVVTGAIDKANPANAAEAEAPVGSPEGKIAQEAAKPEAQTPTTTQASPANVTVGVYINDIQDIDFKTNSYIVDLYLWFRWKGPEIDPIKTVEFMNVFEPNDAQRTVLLDAAKEMPDGSLYNIVRYHGRFSKKFALEKYPFDVQTLDFILEDSVSPASKLQFVADTRGIGMNPSMSLPGFKFGVPHLDIAGYTYPTDFGDLSVPSAETYSRAVISVPINRPVFTLVIKTLGPILLIVICSTLVFFINPHFVEGRIGLAITALLTLVAIQFTAAQSLPDADYFTMLDKLYMLSYAFIIASLLRVVMTSWHTVEGSLQDLTVSKRDHWWGAFLLVLYGIIAVLVASWVLAK